VVTGRRPRIFAHRGASAVERENTVAAFAAAVAMGADGVELDVRRTADGALAVHHDAHLADGRLLVEVAAGDLPSEVPSLVEALAACGDVW
jgi:glycerophosphoryl diester phosphodiesterase